MIDKIAHIGIAVKSIDEKLKLYRDILGLKIGERIEVTEQGVVVLFIETGETKLELLQPLNENANINKFLEKNGEGLHHICFEVEDIHAALKHLEKNEIQMIDKHPRMGAGGELIAFIHPKSTGGVLIELEQKKQSD